MTDQTNHNFPPVPEIVGMGHALLDTVAFVDEEHIAGTTLRKGDMNPVSAEAATELSTLLAGKDVIDAPGGSMSNSLGVASALGARTSFICRVGNDTAGDTYRRAVTKFGLRLVDDGIGEGNTGRCIIHVTPDAERTMATSLGDCQKIPMEHALHPHIRSAKVFAFDGYMLDNRATSALVLAAVLGARINRSRVVIATSLGSVDSARRNRDNILTLARRGGLNVLFGNEEEMAVFSAGDIAEASSHFSGGVYETRGPDGVTWHRGAHAMAIPAQRITRLVDTTGAGDAFAGGVLFGLARYQDPRIAAEIGLKAAAEIIQQHGAQPMRDLAHLGEPSPEALRALSA